MQNHRWDFFLAHAAADLDTADELYGKLAPYARVFLDRRCLKYGDDWDHELAKAQRATRITVVLVSSHTDRAYYEREEIAAAITMARQDPTTHRVVPIYLDHVQQVPYGLRTKHAIEINDQLDLEHAARELLRLLGAEESESSASTVSRLPSVTLSELETQVNNFPISPYATASFKLSRRHHVRLEARSKLIGVTIVLSIDGEEVFREWSTMYFNAERTFQIDGIECRLSIQGLIFGKASFSVGGQEIIAI
ncbi:MAG: toll/interleukin-1 receptor domain-containing protein [Gammaproteobacteria bacterium]